MAAKPAKKLVRQPKSKVINIGSNQKLLQMVANKKPLSKVRTTMPTPKPVTLTTATYEENLTSMEESKTAIEYPLNNVDYFSLNDPMNI